MPSGMEVVCSLYILLFLFISKYIFLILDHMISYSWQEVIIQCCSIGMKSIVEAPQCTVGLSQISHLWLTSFFAINVDFEGHSAAVFTRCKKKSSLTESLVLMQVQCQFTSGLKNNSTATPQQREKLKAQNFVAWPKPSLEAIFGFMACGVQVFQWTLDWTSLQLLDLIILSVKHYRY